MDPRSHHQSAAIFAPHLVERATLQRVAYSLWDSVEEDKEWEAEDRNTKVKHECEWQLVQRRNKGRSKAKGTGSSNANRGLQVVERKKGPGFILRCFIFHRSQGSYIADRMDFHTVNLEKGEIYLNSLPPIMVNVSSTGNMLRLDSMIYLIGGKDDLYPTPPDVQLHQYDGASCLDLSPSPKRWVNTTGPEVSGRFINRARYCVSLCGKIYSFGAADCRAEVYDPNGTCTWNKLSSIPSDADDTAITLPVLPDPAKDRLLVLLKKSRNLYAFYPLQGDDGQGEWLFICDFKLCWECATAVAENIIYFSIHHHDSDLVRAYDIIKKERLRCFWSNHSLCTLAFDNGSLYPGNNGRMYFVGSYLDQEMVPYVDDETTPYVVDDPKIVVAFLKFRVKRVENSELELTPISLQWYKIPSGIQLVDFVPAF